MSQERQGDSNLVIEETIEPRAVEAFMRNYRDAQQAFLELVDNSVDDKKEREPLMIRIRISRDAYEIYNTNGKGSGLEGLRKFFAWGHSEKTEKEIGQYGVGGKGAMGYLGRGIEVVCSEDGSDIEYRVADPSWESRIEGQPKRYIPEVRKATTQAGYFKARVTEIKKPVSANALSAKLGDIYLPLLRTGEVVILINGKPVKPLDIRYKTDDPIFRRESFRVQTRFGEEFALNVGVLEEGQRIKPGIRCYYRGRLITDEEFFGHPGPAQMPQSSRLIGEAHLDFVPVTANKSSFDRDSFQWKDASTRINLALKPWMEKLAKLKVEKTTPVENWEKEMVKRAKRMLENVFANTGLVTKMMLPGESTGRREATPKDIVVPPTGKKRQSGTREGATAPGLDATVGLETVKRWGALYSWDVVSMGNSSMRSAVADENGKRVLKVNTDYPEYQAMKKAGEDALELYTGETAIWQLAQEVIKNRGGSIEELVGLSTSLIAEMGTLYQNHIKEKPTTRTRRGQ